MDAPWHGTVTVIGSQRALSSLWIWRLFNTISVPLIFLSAVLKAELIRNLFKNDIVKCRSSTFIYIQMKMTKKKLNICQNNSYKIRFVISEMLNTFYYMAIMCI